MFYLGTHRPNWLGLVDVPLFVSRRVLAKRRTLPRAVTNWCLDSGGFTELSMNGRWSISIDRYAAEIDRYAEEIGNLSWAAPMDWMCEPHVTAKTGLSVNEHQRRTVDNYLALRSTTRRVIPVLQGWTLNDYLACVELYDDAGIDLTNAPTVGVGSICRRGQDSEINAILAELRSLGLENLHAFGVRGRALHMNFLRLHSADSMAWSYAARRNPPLPGHTHKSCANCLEYALAWRTRLLARASRYVPLTFDLEMTA